MTVPLFEQLPQITSSINGAQQLLLFLDFDGTLAPIDPNPGTASIPTASRRALRTLIGNTRFSVAIISGRALPDLRERVRMEEIIYAGNHGLEITGPGMHFIEPMAASQSEALEELARHLHVRLRHIPGVEVENKVLSASIHYRRASAEHLDHIYQTVRDAVGPAGHMFQLTLGLKVFEIRPRVSWDKGAAVRWIQEALSGPDALAFYLGDDLTDEDAFAAMPEAITVSVGRATGTCARYHLEAQDSVKDFLTWLAGEAAAWV